jgi:hypothetical protein
MGIDKQLFEELLKVGLDKYPPRIEDIRHEGWLTANEYAIALQKKDVCTVRRKLRKAVDSGTWESLTVMEQKSRSTAFRPKKGKGKRQG